MTAIPYAIDEIDHNCAEVCHGSTHSRGQAHQARSNKSKDSGVDTRVLLREAIARPLAASLLHFSVSNPAIGESGLRAAVLSAAPDSSNLQQASLAFARESLLLSAVIGILLSGCSVGETKTEESLRQTLTPQLAKLNAANNASGASQAGFASVDASEERFIRAAMSDVVLKCTLRVTDIDANDCRCDANQVRARRPQLACSILDVHIRSHAQWMLTVM